MPKDEGHIGHGASGLKGRKQLTKEVLALRDKKKKEQEFEKNVAENIRRAKKGKKARTLKRALKEAALGPITSVAKKIMKRKK